MHAHTHGFTDIWLTAPRELEERRAAVMRKGYGVMRSALRAVLDGGEEDDDPADLSVPPVLGAGEVSCPLSVGRDSGVLRDNTTFPRGRGLGRQCSPAGVWQHCLSLRAGIPRPANPLRVPSAPWTTLAARPSTPAWWPRPLLLGPGSRDPPDAAVSENHRRCICRAVGPLVARPCVHRPPAVKCSKTAVDPDLSLPALARPVFCTVALPFLFLFLGLWLNHSPLILTAMGFARQGQTSAQKCHRHSFQGFQTSLTPRVFGMRENFRMQLTYFFFIFRRHPKSFSFESLCN